MSKKLTKSTKDNENNVHLPSLAAAADEAERILFAEATHKIVSDNESQLTVKNSGTLEANVLWNNDLGDWNGPFIQIINSHYAEEAYEARHSSGNMQEGSRLYSMMKSLRKNGEYRKLATIPLHWRVALDELEMLFPNFAEVIHYFRSVYALAACGDRVPAFAPLLLNGPPGVGKTYFANYFAEQLGSGLQVVQMATAQSNSGLSGSAEYWGNTRPGAVFNGLTQGEYANPVFLIDEIDKVCDSQFDPLASLYTLLEPRSAAEFTDESFPWLPGMDASRVIWMCTSNDASLLPEPILSRLRTFDIPAPTEKQAKQIVSYIFRDVMDELPEAVSFVRLSPAATKCLIALSPRQMRQAIREGVGRAVYAGRRTVLKRDIPAAEDEEVQEEKRMGFLP